MHPSRQNSFLNRIKLVRSLIERARFANWVNFAENKRDLENQNLRRVRWWFVFWEKNICSEAFAFSHRNGPIRAENIRYAPDSGYIPVNISCGICMARGHVQQKFSRYFRNYLSRIKSRSTITIRSVRLRWYKTIFTSRKIRLVCAIKENKFRFTFNIKNLVSVLDTKRLSIQLSQSWLVSKALFTRCKIVQVRIKSILRNFKRLFKICSRSHQLSAARLLRRRQITAMIVKFALMNVGRLCCERLCDSVGSLSTLASETRGRITLASGE